MIKLITAVALLIGMHLSLVAQPINFPPDKDVKTSNLTPLMVGNDVKGYAATIFLEDIKSEDEFHHNLLIMDVNFKIIRDVNFTSGKLFRERYTYNGKSHCVTFLNLGTKQIQYVFLDDQGKKIGQLTLDDLDLGSLYPYFNDALSAVSHTGYFRTGPNPKKLAYAEMLDSTGKSMWRLQNKEVVIGKEKGWEYMKFFRGDSIYIVLDVHIPKIKQATLESKTDRFFRVHNTKTGDKLFEINHRHAKGYLTPMDVRFDNANLVVFGEYFDYTKTNTEYDRKGSLGFFSMIYDKSGKLLSEDFNSWQEELSKFMEVDEKNKVEDGRNIWFHEIIHTADDKYFVIGELYTKTMGFVTSRDLIALELDAKLSLVKVHRFEKFKSTHSVVGQLGPYYAGHQMKTLKLFDYQFTTQTQDNAVFTSVYKGHNPESPYKKKFVIGAVGYNQDGEVVNPKIALTSTPDEIRLIPAKNGYVAIMEIFEKEKSATLTLYKFDL